jgi:PIN domain nuclease of toxin-antitoxin system
MIWSIADPARLRPETRDALEDPDTDVFVSVASAWEAGIKRKSGKLQTPDDLAVQLESKRFVPLAITLGHALAAGDLPLHHRDPFDRMLIAQAQLEDLTIVTRDRRFAPYDVALLPA